MERVSPTVPLIPAVCSAGILPAVARASCPRGRGRGRPHDSRRDGGATFLTRRSRYSSYIRYSRLWIEQEGTAKLTHENSSKRRNINDLANNIPTRKYTCPCAALFY